MKPTRVMVVDDAVVIRRMVTDVLSADPDIEVSATAANGKIALAKIPQVNPDLITLDVEMPEMNGLETLRAIRQQYPKLPVIMFSTLTARGAETTLDALAAGANDYVTKPANVGSVSSAMTRIRDELIPKIKALTTRMPPLFPRAALPDGYKDTFPRGNGPVDAVVIGVSTGGPNALAEVIPALPANLSVPVFVVQHMPPVFTRLLAERLDARSAVTVKEAQNNEAVVPGTVYLAPGDFHMVVTNNRQRIRLNQDAPENSCRPAVDVLFRSAALAYGSATMAVVLTGMGQDGLRGAEFIRATGGHIIAQDEATSVVWGMPGAIAREHLADKLVPLSMVAHNIICAVNEKALIRTIA